MTPDEIHILLQKLSEELGFISTGVAKARRLDEEETTLRQWLANGYAGNMHYLHNHIEKRLDPGLLVENAKSVVTFLYSYYTENAPSENSYKVARYARGEDYHRVLKDKIHLVVQELEKTCGQFSYRVFVDSAPVMERQWAALAGLGWIGKHGLLLRQGAGSFFFIGTLVCDLEIAADSPVTDHCGTCTACIDACPTEAIVANGVLDASRCISYHTIELKDDIPEEFRGKTKDWIFGCDICQEVCPWNRFSTPHQEARFNSNAGFETWSKHDWQKLNSEDFNNVFAKSAITRAGFEKLKSNIEFNG